MNILVRQICILSVFFGVMLHIVPEGNIKRIAIVLCTVILTSVCIEAVKGFDFESYTMGIAKYRDESAALGSNSQDLNRELNRLVIEESCETYIKDKGAALGLELHEVDVKVQWSMEGIWCPVSAHISSEELPSSALISAVEAELGIPQKAVQWNVI